MGLATVAALGVVTSAVALAQDAAAQPEEVSAADEAGKPATPTLEELVEWLGSDNIAQREYASKSLMSSEYTEADLLDLLRDDLDLERGNRVRAALFRRFSSRERGAIGIRFTPVRTPPRIEFVYESHPAGREKLLKAGDELLSIDGVSLEGADAVQVMRNIVVSKLPGETISCEIDRDGETQTVDVPLGSWGGMGAQLPPEDYERAWRYRLEQLDCAQLWDPCETVSAGDARLMGGLGQEIGLTGVNGMSDLATLVETVGFRGVIAQTNRRRVINNVPNAIAFRQPNFLGPATDTGPRLDRTDAMRITMLHADSGGVSRAGVEADGLARELARLESELTEAGQAAASPETDPAVRRRAGERAERLRERIAQVRATLEDAGAGG